MSFDAIDAEDYALGQAMTVSRASAGLPAQMVTSYPDDVPGGSAVQFSNGWSMGDFTSGLQSVANSVTNVAKTIYGFETAGNQLALQRLQTSAAIDIARAQTATTRDVALAESQTAIAKAQATSKQSAQLSAQLGGGDMLLVLAIGAAVWFFARGGA